MSQSHIMDDATHIGYDSAIEELRSREYPMLKGRLPLYSETIKGSC
jgi:hypothetical protein